MKRMFQGFGIIILSFIGTLVISLITVFLAFRIGVLAIIAMYIIIVFMVAIYLVARSIIRNGHRIVHTWDSDAADEQGSTARVGFPQDPGGVYIKRLYPSYRRPDSHYARTFSWPDDEQPNDQSNQPL